MNQANNMIPIAPATNNFYSYKSNDSYIKKRTRAKRSCDMCRKRKTKCDGDVKQPCTKCELAQVTCEFLVEQKKRGPASGGYIEELENRLLRMEKLLENLKKDKNIDDTECNDDNSTKYRNSSSSSLSTHKSLENDCESTPKLTCPSLIANKTDKEYDYMEQQMNKLTISDYQRTRYIGASSGVQLLDTTLFQTNVKHHLPDEPSWFIQKLNDEKDEHVIMKSKQIPPSTKINEGFQANRIELFEDTPHITPELADYLIHVYFTRIHVYCPVINKTRFLEQYYFHNPTPPDKYLLFAITSIGTSLFIPEISHIKSFHFSQEQLVEIRDVLKEKAHTILNVVYKRSMISTVQTLMLLSMFVTHDDDEEDTAHWFITGMAIRMAQDLGLHRDCSKWKIPKYEIELRKRIWYGAYLMDRWVAAELGRPVSILDHEFDVELPTPYELNTPLVHHGSTTPILILEAEAALQQNIAVYSGFVHLITLSQIAGQVLVGFHSTRAKHNRENNLDLLKILESNLTNWKLTLPKELILDVNSMRTDIFYVPACVVNMACDCVWILLYRSFIKHNRNQPENIDLASKALSICTASAVNLVSIVESVELYAFVSLPWNMAIYAVFQAAIIFLHNAKGENTFLKDQGKQYLIRCAKLYNDDPYLRKSRAVRVLQHVASNFEVFIGDDTSDPSLSIAACLGNRRKRAEESKNTSTLSTSYSKRSSNTSDNNSYEEPATKHPRKQHDNLVDPFVLPCKAVNEAPADLFLSSLSFGLGKSLGNDTVDSNQKQLEQPQQPQQEYLYHQQQFNQGQQQNSLLPQQLSPQQSLPHQTSPPPQQHRPGFIPEANYDPYAGLMNNSVYSNLPPQATQFDLASLSSEIPLWEVPSGATWNEWESFLKENITDNRINDTSPNEL